VSDQLTGHGLTPKAVALQHYRGTETAELIEYLTEYAATVDDANKRTLDPVVIQLMGDSWPT